MNNQMGDIAYLDKLARKANPAKPHRIVLRRKVEVEEGEEVSPDKLFQTVDLKDIRGEHIATFRDFPKLAQKHLGLVHIKKKTIAGPAPSVVPEIYANNLRGEEDIIFETLKPPGSEEGEIEEGEIPEVSKPLVPLEKAEEAETEKGEIEEGEIEEGEIPVIPKPSVPLEKAEAEEAEAEEGAEEEEDAEAEKETVKPTLPEVEEGEKEVEEEEPRLKEKETRPKEGEKEKEKRPAKKAKAPDAEKGLPPLGHDLPKNAEINGVPILPRLPPKANIRDLIVRAPTYYMNNRKLYSTKLADLFSNYAKDILSETADASCENRGAGDQRQLFIHQRIVREYLNVYTPYRGLLLYHGLGSGKTCTSIAIAEGMKTHKRVFVLTPASLKMNFFSEMKKCGDELYKKNQYWEFISIDGNPQNVALLSRALSLTPEYIRKNAGAWLVNIQEKRPNFADLTPEQQRQLDDQINTMIRDKYVDLNYNGLNAVKFNAICKKYGDPTRQNPFDHSVVLIDEAHNLVSRIVNSLGKKTGVSISLYEKLMDAQDVRIVFMSGTPIINYPNEVAVLFNMLRGYIKTWQFRISNTGKKLTKESIIQMFKDEGLTTYDYIDYSNDSLTITRNPFGFVNVDKAEKRVKFAGGKGEVPVNMLATGMDAPKANIVLGGAKKPKSSTSLGANKTQKLRLNMKPAKKHRTTKRHRGESGMNWLDILDEEPRNTKANIIESEKDVVKHGILLQHEVVPTEVDPDLAEQIELDHRNYMNNQGEDEYHGGSNTSLYQGGAQIVYDKYAGVHLDEQGNISDNDFITAVRNILTKHDITYDNNVTLTLHKCLPDKLKDFTDAFIDMETLTFKRPDVLQKRILGLTSYFRSAQEKLLPQFIPSNDQYTPNYHVVPVEMSDYQFTVYSAVRTEEINKEKTSRKHKPTAAVENAQTLKIASSYRVFSRAACNFAFPEDLHRPMPPKPSDGEVDAEDLDNIVEDNERDVRDDTGANIVSVDYAKQIQHALDTLKEGSARYLSKAGLAIYAPKFLRILENLANPENRGLHLVYSAFRSLEGVGILKLILEANGFAEFKLQKSGEVWTIVEPEGDATENKKKPRFALYTGTETAEEKEIIRNIYNSNWELVPSTLVNKLKEINENNYYGEVIKCIMITSSGAEGINLENTRFVHIVEPYWHMVRIDQVVGRARRICSHKNLPAELRTVMVYIYTTVFSEQQKSDDKNIGIMINDISKMSGQKPAKNAKGRVIYSSVTTDQSLFETAIIKNNLMQQILKSVKETSVDCELYDNSKEGLVCYSYGHATTNEFGSFPDIAGDFAVREGADVREVAAKIVAKTVGDVKYAYNGITNELYDYEAYTKRNMKVLVGHLGKKNGKNVVV